MAKRPLKTSQLTETWMHFLPLRLHSAFLTSLGLCSWSTFEHLHSKTEIPSIPEFAVWPFLVNANFYFLLEICLWSIFVFQLLQHLMNTVCLPDTFYIHQRTPLLNRRHFSNCLLLNQNSPVERAEILYNLHYKNTWLHLCCNFSSSYHCMQKQKNSKTLQYSWNQEGNFLVLVVYGVATKIELICANILFSAQSLLWLHSLANHQNGMHTRKNLCWLTILFPS